MPRPRTMKIGVVNIKTQPHSPKRYKQLLKFVLNKNMVGRIRGDNWGLFGSCRSKRDEDFDVVVFGTIYKYLNIEAKGNWLDIIKRDPIDADDGEAPDIPEHLKPNRRDIEYAFFPKKHRLFFDTQFISPGSMQKLLISIFSDPEIEKKFGHVDVVVETTKEAIKKILKIPVISNLKIDFTIPNDDDLDELEDEVVERIKKQKIRRYQELMTSTDDDGLDPDDTTVAKMNIARSNGKVVAEGYAGDQKIVRSTIEHPLKVSYTYNPELESRMEALIYKSAATLMKF